MFKPFSLADTYGKAEQSYTNEMRLSELARRTGMERQLQQALGALGPDASPDEAANVALRQGNVDAAYKLYSISVARAKARGAKLNKVELAMRAAEGDPNAMRALVLLRPSGDAMKAEALKIIRRYELELKRDPNHIMPKQDRKVLNEIVRLSPINRMILQGTEGTAEPEEGKPDPIGLR